MARQKFNYAAGILDRNANWVWQGTVIAFNIKHARKILGIFKRKNRLSGSIQITTVGVSKTNARIRVF